MKQKKSEFKPEMQITNGKIRIFINGLIHVMVKADEFVGFESWVDNGRYYIEFFTKNQNQDFYTEYDSFEKWKQILTLLNNEL